MKNLVAALVLLTASVSFAAAKTREQRTADVRKYVAEHVAAMPEMSDAAFGAAFARVPADHPRLLGSAGDFAAIRERAKTDPLVAAGVKAVIDHALYYATLPPLEHKLSGRRLLGTCRKALAHISATAMAYRLTGERRHFDAAVATLTNVCAFADWNPKHFLDVAEMSLAVALGYDWLYRDLPPEVREQVAAGLKKNGFDAFVKDAARTRRSRLLAGNNWGQVCNGGAIAAALALWEREGDAARKLLRGSTERLVYPMRVYAPNGAYPEGPGYWGYGTTFNVIALGLLEHACGTEFGLSKIPGFRESAWFRDWVTGPSGEMFNFSDSSLERRLSDAGWCFAAHGDPACVAFFERGALLEAGANRSSQLPRTFPCSLFWLQDRPLPEAPRPRVWSSGDATGITVLRSGWTKDDWFAAFKCGRVGGPHAHLDVGSFVFDACGVRWAGDIGSEGYGRIEALGVDLWNCSSPESERWTLYRLSNASHNVINPEGVRQSVGNAGRQIYVRDEDGVCGAAFDLDGVYAPAIGGWKRRTSLVRGRFTVEDAITGAGEKPVTWGFATKAKATVDGRTVVLEQGGKTLFVRADGPSEAVWSVGPAKGTNPADGDNSAWTRVTLSAPAKDGKLVYKVAFVERRL